MNSTTAGVFELKSPARSGIGRGRERAPAADPTPIVFVIDDDISVRESLDLLLFSAGYRVATFGSAEEFLAYERPRCPCCLVLDLNLPNLNGLDLQSQIVAGGAAATLPIIFITGFGDVQATVRAMKGGAVEFLTKPFDERSLLDAVDVAVRRSVAAVAGETETRVLLERYTSLSVRERQVMRLVISGLLNKQAAAELGISEVTVKAHRGRAMRKMQADSLAHLVVMAGKIGALATSLAPR